MSQGRGQATAHIELHFVRGAWREIEKRAREMDGAVTVWRSRVADEVRFTETVRHEKALYSIFLRQACDAGKAIKP